MLTFQEKQGFFGVLTHVYDKIISFHCSIFYFKLLLLTYFTTDSHRQTPTDRVIFTLFTTYFILRKTAGRRKGRELWFWIGTCP